MRQPTRKRFRLSFGFALSLVVAVLGPVVCTAADDDPMLLNRAGRWAEAARVAEQRIENAADLSARELCELRFHLTYSYLQTARRDDARGQMRLFDAGCSEFPDTMWFRREMNLLRAELDTTSRPRPTARSDDGWSTADAASLGLDEGALAEHRTLCEASGADACLVAYRGSIVQEWYGPGYREPMHSMSSVKSWTGLLAGLLIAEGKLALDDPVSKYIPEWKAGSEAGVTVRHLLTMTSGLRQRASTETGVGNVGDKNAFVFSLALDEPRGKTWAYSNEGVQLLSPILERAAGAPLEEYARDHLFLPLKMRDTRLRLDQAGNPWTYADAETTLRDFAKICRLAIDRGRFEERQVVPEEWIALSTTPGRRNPGYGLLWWLESDPIVHATRGFLNTDCYALPELDLVVARMQRRPRSDSTAQYGTHAAIGRKLADLYRRIVNGSNDDARAAP